MGSVLMCWWGCNVAYSPSEVYFEGLSKNLTNQQIAEFKTCDQPFCMLSTLGKFDIDAFINQLDSIPTEINIILDSVGIIKPFDRKVSVLMAYHKYLNGTAYSYENIKVEFDGFMYDMNNRGIEPNEIIIKENQAICRIAQINFDRYCIGDTMCLELPLEKSENGKNVILYSYYSSENFRDTLFVKCVLLEKEFEEVSDTYPNSIDGYYFTIKVIESKQSLPSKEINDFRVGDENNISITGYGRLIERCL